MHNTSLFLNDNQSQTLNESGFLMIRGDSQEPIEGDWKLESEIDGSIYFKKYESDAWVNKVKFPVDSVVDHSHTLNEIYTTGISVHNGNVLKVSQSGVYRIDICVGCSGYFSVGFYIYAGMDINNMTLRLDSNSRDCGSQWIQLSRTWSLYLNANEYFEVRGFGAGFKWDGENYDNITVEKIS